MKASTRICPCPWHDSSWSCRSALWQSYQDNAYSWSGHHRGQARHAATGGHMSMSDQAHGYTSLGEHLRSDPGSYVYIMGKVGSPILLWGSQGTLWAHAGQLHRTTCATRCKLLDHLDSLAARATCAGTTSAKSESLKTAASLRF